MVNDASLGIQMSELREVSELRWNAAGELIHGKVPERTIMNE